jgi:hypothetical protein
VSDCRWLAGAAAERPASLPACLPRPVCPALAVDRQAGRQLSAGELEQESNELQ